VPDPTAPGTTTKKKGPSGPKAGGDELDDLLKGAIGGKSVSSPKSSSPDEGAPRHAQADDTANLPDQLKSSDIQRGMGGVKSRVSQCYAQFNVPGMVSVTVTISPSGRVSGARVSGKFAGTPTGDCVSRAARGASFPRFKGPAMEVDYPFMLSK
jgi:hypothetical protein